MARSDFGVVPSDLGFGGVRIEGSPVEVSVARRFQPIYCRSELICSLGCCALKNIKTLSPTR